MPLVWWENLVDIAAMQHHFFDTLVYRNPETMEYEPLLATSWERIDDLTLEFKLREGVTFHGGSAFDADDAAVSYSKLINPAAQVLNAGCYPTQVGCSQEVEPYAYDPALSKELLAEAGYGEGLHITIDAYRDRYLLEAILGNLAEVGIDADINMLQWAGLRSKMNDSKVEVAQTGWASSGLNDISGIASVLLKMTPDDYCQNTEVKALLDTADTTIDVAERAATYKQALEKANEELVLDPALQPLETLCLQ